MKALTPKKFKKQYFLFGQDICNILENEGIGKAVKSLKSGEVSCTIYCWDELSTPSELLSEYDGWGNYLEISLSQYNKLSEVNYPKFFNSVSNLKK